MKKALFIGGTGVISGACVQLALEKGFDVTLLNRGNAPAPEGVRVIKCDIGDEAGVRKRLAGGADGGAYGSASAGRSGGIGTGTGTGGGAGYSAGGGGSAGDSAGAKSVLSALDAGGYDVVADFIVYRPEQAERDIRLFSGMCGQYIFISTTAAYQKPFGQPVITESTPLYNPYWQYARDKIACEQVLMEAYRNSGFPVTIVRPSHTYNERKVPVALHGKNGSWQILKRIIDGRPVIIPGDGLNWWTLTFSADFAVGFVGLMGNPHAVGEAVHITSDEKVTWNDVYNLYGRLLGRAPAIANIASRTLAKFDPSFEGTLLGDKANSVNFDNTKIKRLVPEFNATTRFDQGVRLSMEYFLTHKEMQTEDPEFDAFCDMVIEATGTPY